MIQTKMIMWKWKFSFRNLKWYKLIKEYTRSGYAEDLMIELAYWGDIKCEDWVKGDGGSYYTKKNRWHYELYPDIG